MLCWWIWACQLDTYAYLVVTFFFSCFNETVQLIKNKTGVEEHTLLITFENKNEESNQSGHALWDYVMMLSDKLAIITWETQS